MRGAGERKRNSGIEVSLPSATPSLPFLSPSFCSFSFGPPIPLFLSSRPSSKDVRRARDRRGIVKIGFGGDGKDDESPVLFSLQYDTPTANPKIDERTPADVPASFHLSLYPFSFGGSGWNKKNSALGFCCMYFLVCLLGGCFPDLFVAKLEGSFSQVFRSPCTNISATLSYMHLKP